jgi:acyl dehydratase
VRFANPVFPGETLQTRMWKEPGKVVFEVRVKERDVVVITSAAVEIVE